MSWKNNSRNNFENALYDSQYPDENADGGVQLDHCKLYVTNLPKNLNEQGLEALFSKYGNLTKIYLSRDPSKRYAFIYYEAANEARLAMMKLNKTEPLKLSIGIAHKKNNQEQNDNNNSRSSRGYERSVVDEYEPVGRRSNQWNLDGQSDVYEEEFLEDEIEMEEDQDLDVTLQMLHLKEAEIKLKKKILFLSQQKKLNQQAHHGNRSILPDGRIVVRNISERAPVQETFSSAPNDAKTSSSCEESSLCSVDCRHQKYQHEGNESSDSKCCSDIDNGILQEVTEAVFDEYRDKDIPLNIIIDHNMRDEKGCDTSDVCDIDRLRILRNNDYADVHEDLKFVISFVGYPKTKILLYDFKRFSQCIKDIIDTQKASKLLKRTPTFQDCYINNGAIVCVFNDVESKKWMLMVLPGVKERMNCDFILLKLETIRLCLVSIVSPISLSQSAADVLKQLQNLNPELRTCKWKIVKKVNIKNVNYISIVIDADSFEIIRSSFKNIIDFNEMEFEIAGLLHIYGKTLPVVEDYSSIASRVEILKSLNAADDPNSFNDSKKMLIEASDIKKNKNARKKGKALKANKKEICLKTLRDNDYNEINEELKIVVALCDYPTSKICLQHMTIFYQCLKEIIDMQQKANLLKSQPTFLDCYINKGAIVCIFNDIDSKQWFIRILPGLQERMNCDLTFLRTDTTRLLLGKMNIKEGLCPPAVIDVFENMQNLNPNLVKDNWKIISKECSKGKIYTLYFLIDVTSYEIIRSFTFQNIIDYDQIKFEIKGDEHVYYNKITFESDLSSFESRIKLLKDLKPDIFKAKSNLNSTKNDEPYVFYSNCDESSDEVNTCSSTKSTLSAKSEDRYLTVESSDEMFTDDGEIEIQNKSQREDGLPGFSKIPVIQNDNIPKNLRDVEVNIEKTINEESQPVSHTVIEADSCGQSLPVSAVEAVTDHISLNGEKTNHIGMEKILDVFSKIISNSDSWEVRIRNLEGKENEIDFDNPNQINYPKKEDTVKLNLMSDATPAVDIHDKRTICLHVDKNSNEIVENGKGSISNDSLKENSAQDICEVETYNNNCTQVKNEQKPTSIVKSDAANLHKTLDPISFDHVNNKENPGEENEPDAVIMFEVYVHKDYKNVDVTGNVDLNKISNMKDHDEVLTGNTNNVHSYRRKERSYYRSTNYMHVNKDLKLAIVLEDYPTAKLEKSHMRQISRLFNESISKDEELFCDDIPQFEDVYISNGAIIFICESIETKEYLKDLLPELSTSTGLKLKIYNVTRLVKFYKVSMTLPPEISQLESKIILPTLQLSYSNLQTNSWKIYSDIPGEQTRIFGVDGKSLRFLRKSEMSLEYDGHIIACEEATRSRPNVEHSVTNTQSAEEIENNFKKKIVKMMYCESVPRNKKKLEKLRKNIYSDTVPDDFKLYISANNYPEIHIDEINFNEIKHTIEDLAADNWGTFDPFIPRIYDIYLKDGVIFVICEDIKTRVWIESHIKDIGLALDYTISTTEYRGAVGIVAMILKTTRKFEEVIAILQDQNPRLRTKFWRKIDVDKPKKFYFVVQIDALSAQVIRSDNFNGNIDGQTPEFDFGYLTSVINKRSTLEPFNNEDYEVNIPKDTKIDSDRDNDADNMKCEKCLNKNDFFYYSGNDNYNTMEIINAIDDDDYCKADLTVPSHLLTAKGCLDIIFEVLNEKNPKLNTFLWKVEPCANAGHFTVFIDQASARIMKEDSCDSTFAGEELHFKF